MNKELDELQGILCNIGPQLSFVSAAAETRIRGQAALDLLVTSNQQCQTEFFCQRGTPISPSPLRTLGEKKNQTRWSLVCLSQSLQQKLNSTSRWMNRRHWKSAACRGFALCKLRKTVSNVVQTSDPDRDKNIHSGLWGHLSRLKY